MALHYFGIEAFRRIGVRRYELDLKVVLVAIVEQVEKPLFQPQSQVADLDLGSTGAVRMG